MPVANFNKIIFVQALQAGLYAALKGRDLCDTQYEGQIRNEADTVRVSKPVDLTVNAYSGSVSYESPDSTKIEMTITESDYIAAKIKDTEKVKTSYNLGANYLKNGQNGLANKADKYIFEKLATTGDSDNTIDTIVLTKDNVVSKISEAVERLDDQNVLDSATRFVVVSPAEANFLRSSPEFTHASQLGDQVLMKGQIGEVYGMAIIVSNNLYKELAADITTGDPVHRYLPFGVKGAMSFASAIPVESAEVIRLTDDFADGIRALHHYGSKTFEPKLLGAIKAKIGEGTA